MIIYNGKAVGVSFEPHKSNLVKAFNFLEELGELCDPYIVLKHITDNKFDANAVEILLCQDEKAWPVGWIPKNVNTEILSHGIDNCSAQLDQFTFNRDKVAGLHIIVEKI